MVAPALDGPVPQLEHEDARALPEDEAVPGGVEGLAGPGARERGHVGEAGQRGDGVGRLGAAGDHDVASVPGDLPSGVADRMGRRRAGRADRLARSLEAVAEGDGGAAGVGHHHRDEERRHPPLALLHPDDDLLLQCVQAADARADHDPGASGVGVQVAGLLEGLGRRGERELLDAVGAAGFLRALEPRARVPVRQPRRRATGRARSEEPLPERLLADPARRHHAVAGDRDPTVARALHPSLATTRS